METVRARSIAAIALLAATTTALTACAGVVGARMTFDDTEKAKVTDIVIDGSGSADVTVRTGTAPETSIQRIIRTTGDPGPSYRLSDGVMTLPTQCGMNCSLQYVITAPAGVNVRGHVASGDVSLDGVGTSDLDTGSGDIKVQNATGTVKAHSGSGDIDVIGVKAAVTTDTGSGNLTVVNAAGAVSARTGSGDVEIRLAEAEPVAVRSGSGDLKIIVPPGKYRIDSRTGSGDRSVRGGVEADPSAAVLLQLQTGSGDLTVEGAAA
jgi:hypothetical protein